MTMVRKIETEHLVLEAPQPARAWEVFLYARDEEFCRYIDATPAKDERECERFLEALRRENEAGHRAYWVVVSKAEGRAIGTMGYIFHSSLRHKTAEFGYGIGREHWGRGYFQEAARAVLAFGFSELGLSRVQAITRADNVRSIKGVEKLGFVREAVLKSYYQATQGRADAVLMRLLKEEFEN